MQKHENSIIKHKENITFVPMLLDMKIILLYSLKLILSNCSFA